MCISIIIIAIIILATSMQPFWFFQDHEDDDYTVGNCKAASLNAHDLISRLLVCFTSDPSNILSALMLDKNKNQKVCEGQDHWKWNHTNETRESLPIQIHSKINSSNIHTYITMRTEFEMRMRKNETEAKVSAGSGGSREMLTSHWVLGTRGRGALFLLRVQMCTW